MTRRSFYLRGIVEGYYGRTWRHEERLQMLDLASDLGLNAFLYCPKSDPYLRKHWQQPWPEQALHQKQELAQRAAAGGIDFGVGLSPYALYQSYGPGERTRLQTKIAELNSLGAPLLAILFDDMPGDLADLAERQAAIVEDVMLWTTAERILVCPTYYSQDPVLEQYFGRMPDTYWSQLGRLLPPAVDLFWTGPRVCSEQISCADAAWAEEQLGRPVTLWDNYPVNDGAKRSRHLYLDALPGRESGLELRLRGHFCNPMNQPLLSWCGMRGLVPGVGRDWLAKVLGQATLSLLERDGALFQERGLDGMSQGERTSLALEYAALGSAGGAEVAAWLRGEYAFDPACLTD